MAVFIAWGRERPVTHTSLLVKIVRRKQFLTVLFRNALQVLLLPRAHGRREQESAGQHGFANPLKESPSRSAGTTTHNKCAVAFASFLELCTCPPKEMLANEPFQAVWVYVSPRTTTSPSKT